MTSPSSSAPTRVATKRTVLMCRPDYFTVSYRINPWMHPEDPTDTSLAVRQWETLYAKYQELGFEIHLIEGLPGLPDMVYAANGGYVLDGIAFGAKFEFPERQPEGPAYMDWFRANGFDVREPIATNEGEGDMLLVGDTIYAGTGFRTDVASHQELRDIYGREVVTLKLIDPSFYHLDTAFAVLSTTASVGPDPIPFVAAPGAALASAASAPPELAARAPSLTEVGVATPLPAGATQLTASLRVTPGDLVPPALSADVVVWFADRDGAALRVSAGALPLDAGVHDATVRIPPMP